MLSKCNEEFDKKWKILYCFLVMTFLGFTFTNCAEEEYTPTAEDRQRNYLQCWGLEDDDPELFKRCLATGKAYSKFAEYILFPVFIGGGAGKITGGSSRGAAVGRGVAVSRGAAVSGAGAALASRGVTAARSVRGLAFVNDGVNTLKVTLGRSPQIYLNSSYVGSITKTVNYAGVEIYEVSSGLTDIFSVEINTGGRLILRDISNQAIENYRVISSTQVNDGIQLLFQKN